MTSTTTTTTMSTVTTMANVDVLQEDPLSPAFRVGSLVTYSGIFLMGLVGNVLFSYIVISSRSMKNMTYHLLVNLSVSDLLVTCLCGPLHVLCSLVMGYWPFGAFMCYTFSYAQSISVLLSSYTLVVISFERYMSILHPLKPLIPKSGSRYVIVGLWVFAMLASVPTPLQTKYFRTPEGFFQCATEDDLFFHVSNVVLMVMQYFLPVALMSIFYYLVARTIWARRDICELIDSTSHTRINKEMQMLRSRRKMIKMLLVVVACYTICWLPFNVYWVIGLAIPSHMNPYIFTVVHILAVSHTCLNPFIYCWMNRRVRYGFMDIVGQLESVRRCFPSVDWESTGLTRHARQTQFTVVRKRTELDAKCSSNALLANRSSSDTQRQAFIQAEQRQTKSVGRHIRSLRRHQRDCNQHLELTPTTTSSSNLQEKVGENDGEGQHAIQLLTPTTHVKRDLIVVAPPSTSTTSTTMTTTTTTTMTRIATASSSPAASEEPTKRPRPSMSTTEGLASCRVGAKTSLSAASVRQGHKVSVVSTVTNLSFVSVDSKEESDDNNGDNNAEEKSQEDSRPPLIRSISELDNSTEE